MIRRLFINICLVLITLVLLISCKGGESTVKSSDYDVTSRTNVNRVRLSMTGTDENRVEIIIRSRGQMTASQPQDIFLQGSSGIREDMSFLGYDEVRFPFTGGVTFNYTKQANDVVVSSPGESESLASTVSASVSFVINEPGRWTINIYY